MGLKLTIILFENTVISKKKIKALSEKYNAEILSIKTTDKIYCNNHYQQLICSSSGDWICFVSDPKEISLICRLAATISSDRFIIIGNNRVNKINKLLGIRNTSYTLSPLFQKAYLANNLELLNYYDINKFLLKLISHANKCGYLYLNNSYISTQVKNNCAPKKLFRPTYIILKRLLYSRLGIITPTREECIKYNKISKRHINYDEDIPVFIICRDRIKPLTKLVNWLEKEGARNIIFVDNNSTYKPLLEYYDKSPYIVHRLGTNIGQRAPWDSGLVSTYANAKPYIVTDPDVLPSSDTNNTIKALISSLNKYKKYIKVGISLRIDNLPDSYDLKNKVIKWERQFWKDEIEKDIYIADVDTTFALYRPNTPYIIRPALRIAGSYTAEHEPWYQDSNNPTEEYAYYLKHARREIASWGIDDSTSSSLYDD